MRCPDVTYPQESAIFESSTSGISDVVLFLAFLIMMGLIGLVLIGGPVVAFIEALGWRKDSAPTPHTNQER